MSSFVTVIHSARQYKIQCTPAKVLNDVLVEACERAGLDHNLFGLRHGKSNLDLSMSVRLAHLPGGAKLELIPTTFKVGAKVNVALSLPGIPRKTAVVAPDASLWQCLQQFEEQNNLIITRATELRNGLVYRQELVLQILNKEYIGEERLQAVTLTSLGIKSGSIVIRVSYKSTDLLSAATAPTSPVEHQPQTDSAQSATASARPLVSTPAQDSGLITPTTDTMPLEIKARPIEVLIPSTSNNPHYSTSNDQYDDLKMSVEQARAYQSSLANKSQSSGPLLTQKYREQQAMDKRLKSKPDMCSVKFRFSDNVQVISTFSPLEVSSELYAFVATIVTESNAVFKLELLGDRKKVSNDSSRELWRDLQFGKATAVQVIGDVHVKEQHMQRGRDVSQVLAQADTQPPTILEETPLKSSEMTSQKDDEGPVKKVPKWLQKTLGKK